MSTLSIRRSNTSLRALPWLIFACSVVVAGSADAQICRVATGGSSDGSSWANAANLQSALADSACGEVWVAAGTYTPTTGADRTISFNVRPGAAVYGGFVGNESQRSQRNPLTHLTTLSGEIGDATSTGDNSYHVVYMDGTTGAGTITVSTVLDGFTISGGNAGGAAGTHQVLGGGLYCDGSGAGSECSPTVVDVTFSGNRAQEGGGAMYNDGLTGVSSPVLTGVTFSGNAATATYGFGGAMYNNGNEGGTSSPLLTNVAFDNNSATQSGGAMVNSGFNGTSNPVLTNVSFDNNAGQADGGAIFNLGQHGGTVSPVLNHVTFTGNAAGNRGGAIHNSGSDFGTCSPKFSHVTFSDNSARVGGAMSNDGSSSGNSNPELSNVIFSENTATDLGGAMYNYAQISGESSPRLTNVTFSHNRANLAGAMHNDGSNYGISDPMMSNVTFNGNSARASAGAIYNDGRNHGRSSPVISNTTFTGNTNPNEFGGAVYSYAGDGGVSSAQLSNVTFSNNSAALGGALYNDGRSGGDVSPVLKNVILWGDTATTNGPEIYNDAGAGVNISDSVVAGGCASIAGATCGAGNISSTPALGALADNGGFTQTMLPGAGSSAIDAGNDTVCAGAPVNGLDQRGFKRPHGNGCDIGSLEVGGTNASIIFANGFESL